MKEKRIKILLVGSRYTGKGQIGRSWGQTEADLPTLQPVIIYDRTVTIKQQQYVIKAWVLSFDPEFEELRTAFYNEPDGIIYTFDLTNQAGDTFEKVIEFREEIRKNIGKLPPEIIFGIKIDEKSRLSMKTIDNFKKWALNNGNLKIFNGFFYNKSDFDCEVENAFNHLINLIGLELKQ